MKLIRFVALRRILTASALILAAAAGAGAIAPAASASIDCAWQPLNLMNGWRTQESQWGTGDPAFCVSQYGLVYLSGSLAQPVTGPSEIADLPPDAWPASNVLLRAYTYGGTVGTLWIRPDGQMFMSGTSARSFTSLAGLSFTVAGVTQQKLGLLNGWKSADSLDATGDPSYFVSGGIVHMSGSLTGPNATTWNAADLPPAAGPAGCMIVDVSAAGGIAGSLEIDDNQGALLVGADDFASNYALEKQFTSLDGLSFPAAPANWQLVSLLNGWQNIGCGDTSYEIADTGVVYLKGEVLPGTGEYFGQLPPPARPTHVLYLPIHGVEGQIASLEIEPGGNMYIFGEANPALGASLDGVSFHLGS